MRKQPNILLIIADDHQHNAFSCYRQELITPHFDRLMREGMHMERAYMTGGMSQAVCSPSRCSLHTGMTAIEAVDYRFPRTPQICFDSNPKRPHLGEVLMRAGWESAFSGKWHSGHASFCRSFQHSRCVFFGGMDGQFPHPCHTYDPSLGPEQFDHKVPDKGAGEHSTDRFTDAALDFLQHRNREQPFFLNIAFTSPHDPRETLPEFHGLYDPAKVSLPKNFMSSHPFDNGEMKVRDERLAAHPRQSEEIRCHLADYAAMVTHNDHALGRILDHLEAADELENTLIIYTSDHGLAVGQHGLMGKQSMYEHSIRIPMILRGPGIPRGALSDALICLLDLFPTLCDWVGITPPEDLDGRSFAHVLEKPGCQHRDSIFCFYKEFQKCLVTDTWKIAQSKGIEQLFHLPSDPCELNSRTGDLDCHSTLTGMRDRLSQASEDLNRFLAALPAGFHTRE